MDQKLQRGTAASRPLVFRQAADATIPGPHPHCEGKNDRCLTTISSEPATSKKAPSVRSSTSYYTLTFGLLTPFYFIRAGSFVSIPALIAAPSAFIFFLVVKIATKIIGVYPVAKLFGSPNKEAMYTTLLMSTGLTFGTISSLFGLSHGIINQSQYSSLVATVIASAVIPTVIANAYYLPNHLPPRRGPEDSAEPS